MIRNYFHITIDANGRNAKVLGMLDRDKLVDNTIWDIYHYIHGGPDVLIEIQSADAPTERKIGFYADHVGGAWWKIPVSEVNEECSDFLLPWINRYCQGDKQKRPYNPLERSHLSAGYLK